MTLAFGESIGRKRFRAVLTSILAVGGCLLACLWAETTVYAQRPGHAGAGGHPVGGVRMGVPAAGAMARPRFPGGATGAGAGPRSFGFGHPVRIFRRGLFVRRPFFGFGTRLAFAWWPTCGPTWAWGWGFDCYVAPFYGYGLGGYAPLLPYENNVYFYGGGEPDLVWLYLKDGSVYGVSDYWFVDGQMHFSMFEQGQIKPAEHVKPFDELDVEKTVFVNSRRGFRMVMRDEPWEKYLKDHPDLTPPELTAPELAPPQKN